MRNPDITRHFGSRMERVNTAGGITLYAHKSILDSGTGFYPDVPWDSFAASTVERFLEHCYQGDYRVPKPVKLPLGAPTSWIVDGDGCAHRVSHTLTGHLPRCQFVNGRAVPQDNHHSCCFCVTIQDHDAAEGSDTEDDDDKDRYGSSGHPHGLDYFEVFLAHAELYILSQTQGRSSLTALCLGRLRETLEKAAKALVRPRFANNLSDLLFHVYNVYGYSNIKLIDDDQAHDLQNLVLSYGAMHIKETKEECILLMRYGGRVAEGLMEEVANRAISLQSVSKKEMEKIEREKNEREELEREEREREMKRREREREKEEREMEIVRERQMEMEMEKIEREKNEREEREREEREREELEREEREREMKRREREKEEMEMGRERQMEMEKPLAQAGKRARKKARKEAQRTEEEKKNQAWLEKSSGWLEENQGWFE
ncbi:hypothetical protein HOY80DRAFT_919186 [Tuber brumale]|nr:hypothetical protein HOY80DRAFT_919186 [Tuber brumale]